MESGRPSRSTERTAFEIGGRTVRPGERATVDLPISLLSNHQPMTLAVHVVHGRQPGPVLFLSAAIHGDEVIGVEVIRRLLRVATLGKLRGTLLAVPVVNAFGFIAHSRYLPDRRDLNRMFPGNACGSLASQLAHLFMQEVVRRSDYGIDLHSAAAHRVNLPQVRADLTEPRLRALAEAFAAPVMLQSSLRDGSLRQAAQEAGVPVLLYEAGEALRFDELSVRSGLRGVLRVMRALGMIGGHHRVSSPTSLVSRRSHWLRAPVGGVFRRLAPLGSRVEEGETLGLVSDPFGGGESAVLARSAGLVIGLSNLPVVNQGDALFHVAQLGESGFEGDLMDQLEAELDGVGLGDFDGPAPD
ncbi:succinylglutamate desuccinylase/aspartoacylase family protein [Pseudomarimonas salicorniae]|uniref:Succinylglutamate desuccinylase/aspartoacylase family protein n=1 Tax=Pseudomarimonas salicorniae TaxID=2933270 RepID=A0ABT0GL22_9GAMM|nr:succinylglutamate desuccinylase/aspartoacylase family protein [Lysobacter sp. CAU 1642]MCK7595225.1 succinylglutamate desuccinylase/aspartoacylase family protein [Lysobacter sp. CAU 1642]